jgi:hypothetical protein
MKENIGKGKSYLKMRNSAGTRDKTTEGTLTCGAKQPM